MHCNQSFSSIYQLELHNLGTHIESLSATYLTFRRKRLKPIHTLTLTFLNSPSGLGLNLNDTMTLFLTLLCHLNCNLPSMMWC